MQTIHARCRPGSRGGVAVIAVVPLRRSRRRSTSRAPPRQAALAPAHDQPSAREEIRRRRHPSSASVTFALFTYAPPSPTARRAAPAALGEARSRRAGRRPSGGRPSRTSVVGTSASAASSVAASRSRSSPAAEQRAARRHHLVGLPLPVHQRRQLGREPPLRGAQVRRSASRVSSSSISSRSRNVNIRRYAAHVRVGDVDEVLVPRVRARSSTGRARRCRRRWTCRTCGPRCR